MRCHGDGCEEQALCALVLKAARANNTTWTGRCCAWQQQRNDYDVDFNVNVNVNVGEACSQYLSKAHRY